MPIRPPSAVSKDQCLAVRQQIGVGDSERLLLSIGRLSKEKGNVDLIHAFALIREIAPELDARLVLVGEGPERPTIEKLCRALSLSDQVLLTGYESDVSPYYAVADLFLLTSHSEGSPNVLLEAMVAGVPVVATDVGGIPEIATNEDNALLVPPQDHRAIATAAVRILRDPELKKRLVQSSAKVSLRHSPEAYFQSMLTAFRRVVSQSKLR